MFNNPF
jgi:hypothetical protein